MSYECLALNKSGSCCRNWTQVLEDGSSTFTCYTHRNFFNNHEQLKQRVLWHRGMFLEWADHGLQHRIGEWLENRLLRIAPEDFQQFQRDVLVNFSVLFLLIVRHTDVDLSQNMELWVSCVTWLWNHSWRVAWSPGANPHTFSADDMITVLCKRGLSQYYCGLYRFPDGVFVRRGMTEDDWFAFFNQTLEDPVWAHNFWSSDQHEAIINSALEKLPSLRNHPLTPILTGEKYKTWLQESKKAWYERQKERMDCVKEELVAVTCHPSRFITWTMSAEEKADLTRNWDVVSETITPLTHVLEEVRYAFGLVEERVDN